MGNILTPERVKDLGLGHVEAGPIERIDAPAAPTGEARGVRDVVLLSALLTAPLGQLHFLPSASPTMRAHGTGIAFLHENPRIVRIQTLGGNPELTVKPAGDAVLQPEDDPGTVYWDTAQSDFLVLVLPSGVLALESRSAGIDAQFAETVVRVRPLADIRVPLDEWAAACSDLWLSSELRRCSNVGGSWYGVVGAGMLARFFEPTEPTTEAFTVPTTNQMLPWQIPRVWARSLSEEQRETIVDLALGEIDALQLALDTVCGELSPDAVEWPLDWLAICHRRDDVASAFVILSESGASEERLQNSLALLDRRGRRALFNVPRHVVPQDERLQRITLIDPAAWWGSPDDVESVL